MALRTGSECGAEKLTRRDTGKRREKALRRGSECGEEKLSGRDTGKEAENDKPRCVSVK